MPDVDMREAHDSDSGESMMSESAEQQRNSDVDSDEEEGEVKHPIPMTTSSISVSGTAGPIEVLTPARMVASRLESERSSAAQAPVPDSEYRIPRVPRGPPPEAPPLDEHPTSIHTFRGIPMTLASAQTRVRFTIEQWKSWISSRRRASGEPHDMEGWPCVLAEYQTDHAYDYAFWDWVSKTKRVDVDYLKTSQAFAAVNKVRDMRFRFATLVAHRRVQTDIDEAQGAPWAFPVEPITPPARTRTRASSFSFSGDPAAEATGTTVGSRAPTHGPYHGSPQGGSRDPPTYLRHLDTQASAPEVGVARAYDAQPRWTQRGSGDSHRDRSQGAALASDVARDFEARLRQLETDFGQRVSRLENQTRDDSQQIVAQQRRIADYEDQLDRLETRMVAQESAQSEQTGWLNQLWHRSATPSLEARVARMETDLLRRIETLENQLNRRVDDLHTQVNRLLDFQNYVTNAMLVTPQRRLPSSGYYRSRRSASRSPERRFEDTP
jgi:hypothetical protein